jgi:hypothetical protein
MILSAYERLVAARIAEHRRHKPIPCSRHYDGCRCVLEPLHTDWHQDATGRRWP